MHKKNVTAVILFILVLTIHLSTLSPTVNFEDSGEFITTIHTLSISHPPGYPLYTIIGKLFSHLPFGTIEGRINFMSAFFSALACVILFLLLIKLFEYLKEKNSTFLSFFIILFYCISSTLWGSSIVAEVYTLHLFLTSIQLFLIILIFMEKKKKYHLLFFYLTGLGLGNHHTILLNVIIYTVFFIKMKEWKNLKLKNYIHFFLLFILGFSIYLYLPIRSQVQPIINWGNPSGFKNFLAVFIRRQYSDVGAGLINFKIFIKEILTINPVYEFLQFTKPGIKLLNIFTLLFTVFMLYLFFYGLKKIKHKNIKLFLLLLFLLYTFFIILLTNTPEDKLFTLKVFFIPGWFSFYFLMFYSLYKMIKKYLYFLFSLLFIVFFIINFSYQNKNNYYFTRDYAKNILKNLPYKSILFTLKDNETFPIWDLKYVHHYRSDVIIVNLVILSEDWYLKQIQKNYPDLQISLPQVKGLFNKKTIRKFVFQSITNSNKDKKIFFTTKKFQNFINLNMNLQASGLLYELNELTAINNTFFEFSNIENNFTLFREHIQQLKTYKNPFSLDTQTKYILQQTAFSFLEYANNLIQRFDEKRSKYFYQYSIFLNNIVGTSVNNIYSYASLGNIFLIKGENEKALFFYNKAILLQGDTELAKKISEKIKRLSGKESKKQSLVKTAEIYYNKKDFTNAIIIYKQILKINPNNPMVNSNIGDCYFNLKKYNKAVMYYKKAIKLKNNYAIAYYNLGGCYLIIGQKNKAKETWKKGLKCSPEDKKLADALKKYFP